MKEKKLLRKMDTRMICGVCSGVADYLDVDVTVVRVVWTALSLFTSGVGLAFYIAAAFIMPEDGSDGTITTTDEDNSVQ